MNRKKNLPKNGNAYGIRSFALARIFHIGSSRGAANPDAEKEGDGLRRRLRVYTLPEEDFEINAASILLPGLRR